MSSIVDSTIIGVLNYSDSYVSVPSFIKPDGYLFEPSCNGEPFSHQLSFAEIRGINSQSNVFREGILRFDPEVEKEVYEKLGIRDWETILSDSQIRNIILHPTKEGLEKIIRITTPSMFERVRGMLIQLENTGMYDISIRVKNVISERYKEIYNNKRISEIVIIPTVDEAKQTQTIDPDMIAKLKEELTAQIRAELEQQLKNDRNSTGQSVEENVTKRSNRSSKSTP